MDSSKTGHIKHDNKMDDKTTPEKKGPSSALISRSRHSLIWRLYKSIN